MELEQDMAAAALKSAEAAKLKAAMKASAKKASQLMMSQTVGTAANCA